MSERLPSARGARYGAKLSRILAWAVWRVSVHGAENVPESGPVILAPNHLGFVDGPLLYGQCPRPVHTLTKREMFAGPVGWVLSWAGQIPIDRDQPGREALRTVTNVLADGRVVAIFPEGTRGAGDFAELRTGLAWFALRSGAPVVPVVFLGSGSRGTTLGSLPRFRSRIRVVFGEPVRVGAGDGRTSRAALEAASKDLRDALVKHHRQVHEKFGGEA
ncbi:MAG TPA: lysophospholipid acyltransferase family protein [Jiangellaceae bacterium]